MPLSIHLPNALRNKHTRLLATFVTYLQYVELDGCQTLTKIVLYSAVNQQKLAAIKFSVVGKVIILMQLNFVQHRL